MLEVILAASVEAVEAGEAPAGGEQHSVAVAKVPPETKKKSSEQSCHRDDTTEEKTAASLLHPLSLSDHVGGVPDLVEVLWQELEAPWQSGRILDPQSIMLQWRQCKKKKAQ